MRIRIGVDKGVNQTRIANVRERSAKADIRMALDITPLPLHSEPELVFGFFAQSFAFHLSRSDISAQPEKFRHGHAY